MYSKGYSQELIAEYLRYGLLPKLISKTLEWYYELLNRVRDKLYTKEGVLPKWKGSQAQAMHAYHSKKLRQIRELAVSYHHHILGTYVYLRDAALVHDYRHPAMQDRLWTQFQELQEQLDSSGDSSGNKISEGSGCSHCKQIGLHSGGRTNCPGQKLTGKDVRALLRGVKSVTAARKLVTSFQEAIAADPSGDRKDIIDTVRSGQGVD